MLGLPASDLPLSFPAHPRLGFSSLSFRHPLPQTEPGLLPPFPADSTWTESCSQRVLHSGASGGAWTFCATSTRPRASPVSSAASPLRCSARRRRIASGSACTIHCSIGFTPPPPRVQRRRSLVEPPHRWSHLRCDRRARLQPTRPPQGPLATRRVTPARRGRRRLGTPSARADRRSGGCAWSVDRHPCQHAALDGHLRLPARRQLPP